jgi:hypothetical protein
MPSDLNFTKLELDLVSNFDKPEDTWMSHDGKTIVVYTERKAVASNGTTFTLKDLDDPEGTQCRTESHYELSLTPAEVQAIESERERLLDATMNFTSNRYIISCSNPDTADHQERHSLLGDPNFKLNWALHNLRRARTREFVPITEGGVRYLDFKGRFKFSEESGFTKTTGPLDMAASAVKTVYDTVIGATRVLWTSGQTPSEQD